MRSPSSTLRAEKLPPSDASLPLAAASAVVGLHNFLMHEAQGMAKQGAAPFTPEEEK